MAEFKGVVFLEGKVPQDGSIQFGEENDLILLSSPFGIHDAGEKISVILNQSAASDAAAQGDTLPEEATLLKQAYSVLGGDFAKAGIVSTEIKSTLRKIGFDPNLIRRVAIATYEGEMNVVTHAMQAMVTLSVTPRMIEVVMDDKGKGIPDIDLAMQEGYTTASPEIQAMGFGSGMGLPNIRKNADELKISSEVNKGTKLIMRFYV
jgi:anti-sigma regulatory factor (Ser/Thr protein kinase)